MKKYGVSPNLTDSPQESGGFAKMLYSGSGRPFWQVFSDDSNDLAGLCVSVYGGLVPLGFPHSNFTSAGTVYHKFWRFAIILSERLKKRVCYAIISLLLGETGEKPVRVRRRKVQKMRSFLPCRAANGMGDRSLEQSEKTGRAGAKSEYLSGITFP